MPDDLFKVAHLKINPGDVLAVKVDAHLTNEQIDHLESYYKARLPEDVNVLVLGRGMDLKVMRKVKRGRR
jgi:hypothetical protein